MRASIGWRKQNKWMYRNRKATVGVGNPWWWDKEAEPRLKSNERKEVTSGGPSFWTLPNEFLPNHLPNLVRWILSFSLYTEANRRVKY